LLTAIAAARADDPVPGISVFGQRHFSEYIPGDLPLIVTAPHGGYEKPDDLPTRTGGVVESDFNTQELARTIAAVIHAQTGQHVHLVICHLHRSKLDANREVAEAAGESALAQAAWAEYHAFIDTACASAVRAFGVAFLIDLHGHGHAEQHLELGYRHSAPELAEGDAALNAPDRIAASSLRLIAQRSTRSYVEILRGSSSLGALLEAQGFPATPSPTMPVPTEPYFRGGYTIARHCDATRHVTGLQIEANRINVRDTEENRLRFAHALATALTPFLEQNLGLRLDEKKAPASGLSTVP
jgi:N-formylglutamate amidohydrolase